MASVNKVLIVGNLGKDPELRTFPDGTQIANVTVATTDRWRDKNTGENRESTEWHRISFVGRLAVIAGQYLRKGSQIYVEGSLRTRKWTDQQGQERYTTEIRADQMQMLGSRQGGEREGYADAPPAAAPRAPTPPPSRQGTPAPAAEPEAQRQAGGGGFDDMDDDIPFNNPLRMYGALYLCC